MSIPYAWFWRAALSILLFSVTAFADDPAAEPGRVTKPAALADAAQVANLLNEAAAAAHEIPNRSRSAGALLEIANLFHEIGDQPAATALETEAKKIAPRVQVSGTTQNGVVAIVRDADIPASGDQAPAEKKGAEKRIRDGVSLAILYTVRAHLKRREFESALDTCSKFESEDAHNEGLLEVAASMAQSGRVAAALNVAARIGRDSVRSYALVLVTEATAYAIAVAAKTVPAADVAATDFAAAKRIQEKIDDPEDKITALCQIAELEIFLKNSAAAKETFLEAMRIAKLAKLTHLQDLLVLQARMGEIEEALAAITTNDPEVREFEIDAIVRGLASGGQVAAAERLLNSLTLKDESSLGLSLAAIAGGHAMAGDITAGLQTAKRIGDPQFRGRAFCEIANFQIESGDRTGAKTTLLLALESAAAIAVHNPALREVEDSTTHAIINFEDMLIQSKFTLILDVGAVQAKAGDVPAAKRTFGDVLKASEAYQDRPWMRASLIFDLARAESRAGLSNDAAEWGRKLPSPVLRESALRGVAQGLIPEGNEPELRIDPSRANPSRTQRF